MCTTFLNSVIKSNKLLNLKGDHGDPLDFWMMSPKYSGYGTPKFVAGIRSEDSLLGAMLLNLRSLTLGG